jgi:hypothetical protein
VGSFTHELCRQTPIEVEGIPAPEPASVGRVGKEACEGCSFGFRRNDENDDISLGAHCGPLGDLGF